MSAIAVHSDGIAYYGDPGRALSQIRIQVLAQDNVAGVVTRTMPDGMARSFMLALIAALNADRTSVEAASVLMGLAPRAVAQLFARRRARCLPHDILSAVRRAVLWEALALGARSVSATFAAGFGTPNHLDRFLRRDGQTLRQFRALVQADPGGGLREFESFLRTLAPDLAGIRWPIPSHDHSSR